MWIDIPVCPAECVCFGSSEGLQASAAVPEEQLVSGGLLPSAQPVTDTGTCWNQLQCTDDNKSSES